MSLASTRLGRVARALALVVVSLLGISTATFALVHVAPGDPAEIALGATRGASRQAIDAMRKSFELDRPLPVRYVAWIARSARFDFGRSLVDGRQVTTRIAEALPTSGAVALLALAIGYGLAIPLGALGASYAGKRAVRLAHGVGIALYSLPTLALALLLLSLGAPYGSEHALTYLLAAACLATPLVVRLARTQEQLLIDILRSDFVTAARARGAGGASLVFRHGVRNTALPLAQLLALDVPALLSGAVLVEQVFGLSGLGSLALSSAYARDYPVLLAVTMLVAVVSLVALTIAELASAWLDPRVASAGSEATR